MGRRLGFVMLQVIGVKIVKPRSRLEVSRVGHAEVEVRLVAAHSGGACCAQPAQLVSGDSGSCRVQRAALRCMQLASRRTHASRAERG